MIMKMIYRNDDLSWEPEQLGKFQPVVSKVVDDEDKGAFCRKKNRDKNASNLSLQYSNTLILEYSNT